MSEHVHEWKRYAHLDGCHWYAWVYVCACGARRDTRSERKVGSGPWVIEGATEDGCERCAELLAGAERQHSDEVTEAPDDVAQGADDFGSGIGPSAEYDGMEC